MEKLAQTVLGDRPKIYYAGGADDEECQLSLGVERKEEKEKKSRLGVELTPLCRSLRLTALRDQFAQFQRCRLRPRVLVDVAEVDPRCNVLGARSMLPIYIAPAAYARLGHELGEFNLTRGAARTGIVQGVSANASQSFEDILAERQALEKQTGNKIGMAYQIYVNRDRSKTEAVMKEAREGGCTAFFLTVDSPTLGNREADAKAQRLGGSVSRMSSVHEAVPAN